VCSVLQAVISTPILTSLLVGTLVNVDPLAMFMSTVQLVLAPVLVGTALNQGLPKVGGSSEQQQLRARQLW